MVLGLSLMPGIWIEGFLSSACTVGMQMLYCLGTRAHRLPESSCMSMESHSVGSRPHSLHSELLQFSLRKLTVTLF